MTKEMNLRELALAILMEVTQNGEFSNKVLNQTLSKYQYLAKQDRAFLSRLTEGTIERMIEMDYIINQYSNVKVNKLKPVIRNILRLGVYQIKYMDQVPVSAACNESVKLAMKKGFHNLKGFVNGVLRTISREVENIAYPSKIAQPISYLSVVYSMPEWIIRNWLEEFSFETIEKMLQCSLTERETTIRCNTNKTTTDELRKGLMSQGVLVGDGAYVEEALRISEYDSVQRLYGFTNGLFQVQDESSMMVAHAAGIKKDDLIIDVCAAPGGKSLHVAQLLEGTGSVIACDLTEYKVDLIKQNVERLGYTNVEPRVQDALELDDTLIDKADVVIADLPCSGLGVIGKKNDIKYNVTPEKQKDLAQLQRNILHVVQHYVKKGGTLVYSTCTVNREENLSNVEWFVDRYDFELESLRAYLPERFVKREGKESTIDKGYINFIPGIYNTDGFFLARLVKK
ncbi:16S rRNA (cytosine967-C5)-methyltransferase [Anaerosporobacter mobilis DSM 15930]|uniref:16S rRNA (cytosine(967)-C(5))-methyltransferase n=1 Tax=Anaerosporobacter mobilis DSM 15930 TaxID=1120996 RepID=A0A1M7EZS9_9FIRM|nr:16S rRNA (cytosine(967)-C(5))-methyltransferase RsmB [Anaerosporobacter mobilis]SHL97260.1 16S rRNA (cytosine967-C5)-methyltransferase [Anaerosporobacter mobilis DSM 15930]